MKGFTLIEMLVSIAIFSVVMVVALGGLLSMSVADRKAESLKSIINNLNFAVDSMSRAVRTGTGWGCNTTPGTTCNSPGANEIVFTSASGQTVYYQLDTSTATCGQTSPNIGCIERSLNDTAHWQPITAPEVIISNPSGASLFYMVGSQVGSVDNVQPTLHITINGLVQVTPTQTSPLHLQTSVTQRLYDQ